MQMDHLLWIRAACAAPIGRLTTSKPRKTLWHPRRLDGINVHVDATNKYRKGPPETRKEICPMTGSQGVLHSGFGNPSPKSPYHRVCQVSHESASYKWAIRVRGGSYRKGIDVNHGSTLPLTLYCGQQE